MVIKGVSCAGARRLAVHLMRTNTNERVDVKELRGVAAENLRDALLEMEAVASGTRSTKPFYHASINTRANERLTDEQRAHAIDRLEAALGLTGQARAVVVHVKEGREHCHIVWSRIDLDRMAAISDSHNYRTHELVARALEREFGHERVQGAHIERDGKPRPPRTPSHAEMLQADRTGLSSKQAKEQITELWHSSDSGQAFAVALWQAGYVLARGDRRDYVVIDPMGGTHSLARRVDGARVKDIRERLTDLGPERLPSIEEAKLIQSRRQERDLVRPGGAAREIGDRKPLQRGADIPGATRGAARSAGDVASLAGDVLGGIASIFEDLIGGEEHKPQTPEERAEVARDQQERAADIRSAAEEERLKLQRIDDDSKRNQGRYQEFRRELLDEQHPEIDRKREGDRDRSR